MALRLAALRVAVVGGAFVSRTIRVGDDVGAVAAQGDASPGLTPKPIGAFGVGRAGALAARRGARACVGRTRMNALMAATPAIALCSRQHGVIAHRRAAGHPGWLQSAFTLAVAKA